MSIYILHAEIKMSLEHQKLLSAEPQDGGDATLYHHCPHCLHCSGNSRAKPSISAVMAVACCAVAALVSTFVVAVSLLGLWPPPDLSLSLYCKFFHDINLPSSPFVEETRLNKYCSYLGLSTRKCASRIHPSNFQQGPRGRQDAIPGLADGRS